MLDKRKAKISLERPARKEPLTDAEARKLLKTVSRVTIAKGKKVDTLDAKKVKLADLKGPTGNYRAPLLVRGNRMLVGFNADAIQDFV